MVFTFARISVACGLNVGDIFHQQRRLWLRLHEKGGKFHEMPCHHTLEGYLVEYIEPARLGEAARVSLSQAIKHRPYGRGQAELFHRVNAWKMVQRRARAAGITTEVCNLTFRGTGITAYLENGGTLEKARQMAAHASTRTTQLYDRREDRVTLDEVEKISGTTEVPKFSRSRGLLSDQYRKCDRSLCAMSGIQVRCHISAACIQNVQGVSGLNPGIAPAESPVVKNCGTFIGVGDLSCSFQLSRRLSIILVCALEVCSK